MWMETLYNAIVKSVFEAFYIVCWVWFMIYILQPKLYKAKLHSFEKQIKELNKKTMDLTEKSKILEGFMLNNHFKTKAQLKKLQERLETQLKEKDLLHYTDLDTDTDDEVITFPHYHIYDKNETDDKEKLKSLKCLSKQLTKFMCWQEGRTTLYENVEAFMEKYFHSHSKEGVLVLEPRIKKLLNISLKDNPKITWTDLMCLICEHLK
jgi:hypothetical protein